MSQAHHSQPITEKFFYNLQLKILKLSGVPLRVKARPKCKDNKTNMIY